MKHKYLAVLVAFPFFSFSAATALAATAENTDTGACSENRTSITITNTTEVRNTNVADVSNDIDAHLSTGGNTEGGNVHSGNAIFGLGSPSENHFDKGRSGQIETGDANAAIKVENKLNQNKTVICESGKCELEKEAEGGKGGGPVTPTANVTPETSGVSPAEGGMGGGPAELAAAGVNTPLLAVPLALGTLAMLYLVKLRKRTFNN